MAARYFAQNAFCAFCPRWLLGISPKMPFWYFSKDGCCAFCPRWLLCILSKMPSWYFAQDGCCAFCPRWLLCILPKMAARHFWYFTQSACKAFRPSCLPKQAVKSWGHFRVDQIQFQRLTILFLFCFRFDRSRRHVILVTNISHHQLEGQLNFLPWQTGLHNS